MKITPADLRTLQRLAAVAPGKVLHAHGRLRENCGRLCTKGLARFLTNDKWLGAFFEITELGRAELEKGTKGK